MTKTLTALAAAATLAIAAIGTPQPAEARGGAVAAGVLGGLIVGSALAGPHYYGYYGPRPYYYAAGPGYYGPGCYWRRERFWDGYGWRLRPVRVCG